MSQYKIRSESAFIIIDICTLIAFNDACDVNASEYKKKSEMNNRPPENGVNQVRSPIKWKANKRAQVDLLRNKHLLLAFAKKNSTLSPCKRQNFIFPHSTQHSCLIPTSQCLYKKKTTRTTRKKNHLPAFFMMGSRIPS